MTNSSNRFYFILFVFISLASLCSGNIDELKVKLNKAKKNEKVEILINISKELIETGEYEDAVNFLEDANKLLDKKPDLFWQSEIEFLYGEVNYYLDENNNAIDYYKSAIKYSIISKNKIILGQSYYKIGLTFYYLSSYDNALAYLDTAILFSIESKNQKLQGKVYEAFARIKRETNELDEAIDFVNKAISIYLEIQDINGLANAYNSIGRIYFNLGENQKSIYNYNQSLNYWNQLNDKEGIAIQNVNIGNVYWKLGDYEQAIKFLQEALKYFEGLNHKNGIATSLNSLGACYDHFTTDNQSEENIKKLKTALSYYEKALKVKEELSDSIEISNSYLNIANVKSSLIDEHYIIAFGQDWRDSIIKLYTSDSILDIYKEPLQMYLKSLYIKDKLGDFYGLAKIKNNLGKLYLKAGEFLKALDYFNQSIAFSLKINDIYTHALSLREIANIYFMQKQYNKALTYFHKSLDITKKNNYKNLSKHNFLSVSQLYEKLGNTQYALENYKHYTQIKDSIVNEEKYKQIAMIETKYETEKKEKEILLLNKDNELQKNKVKQARLVIILISIGGLLIIFFLIIVYRQFLEKQKANLKLKAQNKLIKKQKEDITDSITYASRIQSALLTPKEIMDELLKEYFILFLPKDIVSGDFYWVTSYNKKVLVVTADCTGHGVPGAFMSMLGISFLNEIVNTKPNYKANEILYELRLQIIKSLRQSMQAAIGKDGMDLALTIIDRNNLTIEYAGAFNPLIICRNGELIEQKGDRMPVGIHFNYEQPFENYLFELKKGDMVYTFSDGFQDQFGGTDKRKFMAKRFKDLLLEIYTESVDMQKEILQTSHDMWKGAYPQLDDILIMGIRI